MNCTKCEGETRVLDTRLQPENHIRRRRECLSCGARILTYESTVDPIVVLKHRAAQAERKKRMYQKLTPEERSARWKRTHLRESARKEAAVTGKPLEAVYQEWGIQ